MTSAATVSALRRLSKNMATEMVVGEVENMMGFCPDGADIVG